MATNKQIEANRANATKSTGPRSQAGKARSRLNSRKHGLTAKTLIIVGECADDFERLRTELTAEHDPQSTLECELVEHLAGILWRLRRVPHLEAWILDAGHAKVMDCQLPNIWHASEETEEEDEEQSDRKAKFGYALINYASLGDALGKLERHEASLMNGLTKTLKISDGRSGKPERHEGRAGAA